MLRRLLRGLGFGLLGLVLLASLLLGLLQTDWVRARLLGLAQDALASQGLRLEVTELEGFVPFRLDRLTLRLGDAEGVWLVLDRARLAWSPLALLGGMLHVREVGAERVEFQRPPVLPGAPEPEPASTGLPAIRLPEAWPPVVLERLDLPRIQLGTDLLGEAAEFSLEGGGAAESGSTARFDLLLVRRDKPSARLVLTSSVDLADRRMVLRIEADEASGLVGRLLGQPGSGPWRLRLNSEAPLDDWLGELQLSAGGLFSMQSALRLRTADHLHLDVEGALELEQGLLPPKLTQVLGQGVGFRLDLQNPADQEVRVQSLEIRSEVAMLEASAALNLDTGALTGEVGVTLGDLGRLEPLLDAPLGGTLRLKALVADNINQPQVRLSLDARALALPGGGAGELAADVRLTLLRPLDEGYLGARVVGQGRVGGLRLDALPDLAEDELQWGLDLTAPGEGALELRDLTVSGRTVRLAGHGSFDPTTLSGELSLGGRLEDLGLLSGLAGMPLEGSVALDAKAQLGTRATVVLDARAEGVAGLPSAVAGLLGKEPGLGLRLEMQRGELARLEQLELKGQELLLKGSAEADLRSERLQGSFDLHISQLAVLGESLNTELAGNLDLGLGVGGTWRAPALEVTLQGRDLVYAGRDVQRLVLDGVVEDLLAAPRGLIRATLGPGDEAISLGAGFSFQGQKLRLSELRLDAPASQLRGELDMDLEGPRLEGWLRVEVLDLAALDFWHGVEGLAGNFDLDARARSGPQGQGLELKAQAREVKLDAGKLEGVDLRLGLTDLFGRPEIDGRMTVHTLQHPDVSLDNVEVEVGGQQQDLTVGASVVVSAPLYARLETKAHLQEEAGGRRVDLEALSGTILERRVELDGPTAVLLKPGTIGIRDFRLKFGEARISAAGDYGARGADLQVGVQDLPLELLASFGAPRLQGRVNSRLVLKGKGSAGAADLEMDVTDLSSAGDYAGQLPPLTLEARASLAQGRLVSSVELSGVPQMYVRGDLVVPMVLTIEPTALTLAEQAPLGGTLKARADLGVVSNLLELDTQSLGGRLDADLGLSGTRDRPGVTGNLELVDGSYENGLSGTLLKNIQVRIEGRGRDILLTRLQATDGASGTISGTGEVSLEQAGGFPHQVRIDLNRAELVRRDDASAELSGHITLEGSQTRGALNGQLTVNQAEIRIPDRFGPDVPELEVIEVRDGGGAIPEPAPRLPPYALQLGVQVDIPGRTFVRGRGLESEWQGKVKVSGPADRPLVVGDLSVRRGYFYFLERRFDLRRGVIDFHGRSPPMPYITVEAEAVGHEMTGVVRLRGPADNPKLSLESEPPLPQDEILARLLFDRHLEEITPFQALSLADAVRTLALGGTGLMGRARSSLGLDALDFSGDGAKSGSVKAGKYLREDVFLEVEGGIGEAGSKVRVEWELTPSISVESSVDEKSNSAFGINWKYDY